MFNVAFANTISLTNCSQLKAPKTIVLVYAEWCPNCRHFLPEYKGYSNKAKYSGWKFYTVADNDFHDVCGAKITVVPTLFKNNMNSVSQGEMTESQFDRFITNK
jgi:thiol-disulfide isomerase/thioredoxin